MYLLLLISGLYPSLFAFSCAGKRRAFGAARYALGISTSAVFPFRCVVLPCFLVRSRNFCRWKMYTRSRNKTGRKVIAAAEPSRASKPQEKKSKSASKKSEKDDADAGKDDEETPPRSSVAGAKKVDAKNPGAASTVKKSKKSDAGGDAEELFMASYSFYILPLELPMIRREILAKRILDYGGKALTAVTDPTGKLASYIIVDDRVDLSSVAQALIQMLKKSLEKSRSAKLNTRTRGEASGDDVGGEWSENDLDKAKSMLVDAVKKETTYIVKAQWLGECFREKRLLNLGDAKSSSNENGVLNPFILNFLRAPTISITSDSGESADLADDVPGPSQPRFKFSSYRDETPDRQLSYHSDDDHKSVASVASDISVRGGTDDEDSSLSFDDVEGTPKKKAKASPSKLGEDSGSKAANQLEKSNFFLSPASGKTAASENQRIIDQLEELMKTYRNLGDQFRGYAYARAISALRKYPKPITSAQQLKDLKNVGPRIAAHIMEIVETGKLERTDEVVHNDDVNATINMFMNIHGVGTKTAQKWVQMGLRTLDDLRTNPNIHLSTEQKIGLKYYKEFQIKMPRSEVEEIFKIIHDTTESIHKGFIYQVCGSYRRGREMCGDVDILMTHPDGKSHDTIIEPLISKLHLMGFLTDDLQLADGRHKKYLGVCKLPQKGALHRRVDIIIPPYHEWAACVLGWSGSMYFVRSIRDYAHKKGMHLSDHSLNKNVIRKDGETVYEGEIIPTPTEESIFEALGLPYRTPEERDH